MGATGSYFDQSESHANYNNQLPDIFGNADDVFPFYFEELPQFLDQAPFLGALPRSLLAARHHSCLSSVPCSLAMEWMDPQATTAVRAT